MARYKQVKRPLGDDMLLLPGVRRERIDALIRTQKIRKRRGRKGTGPMITARMTHSAFAESLGMTRDAWSKIFRRDRWNFPETHLKIAKALNVHVLYLVLLNSNRWGILSDRRSVAARKRAARQEE